MNYYSQLYKLIYIMKTKSTILLSVCFLFCGYTYSQNDTGKPKEKQVISLEVKKKQPAKATKVMVNKNTTTNSHLKALNAPKETPIKKEEKQEIKK